MSEDLESRILVISASLEQARTAVKLIKAFVDDTSELPSSNSIPWTIKNKYYSADVHFHLIEYAHWDPLSARRVPAVIFVWARGQPYAEHVFSLHNGLSRFEPEVSLAIALGHEPPHHDDPPEGPDSFLADHGFEYIDGERTRYPEKIASASASEENGEDNDDEDDVQGLSRVVDALSTIMWPTMVRKQANNIISGKRESELRPSLLDFDDDDDNLLADDDEEATLAALMEADAVDQGAPQTRASRMRREMQALERWLVENEELHEREFGGADGVDDDDDGDEDNDEDRDYVEHDGSGGDAPPPSVQVSALAASGVHAAPVDDPWAASTTSNPTSTSTLTQTQTQTQSATLSSHSISITTPRSSGFDDDFSAFVSAPATPSVTIAGDTAATAKTTPASTTASASSEPIVDARRLYTQTQLLLPSHTGGSVRSIRSAMSDLSISDTGDDLGVGGGYEALDDISNDSLNFSPEHGDVEIDDGDPGPSISGQRSGDRAASLGDVPFHLPNILNALQTIREDVAGIEDEAERRATTARFASEFVYKRMGVDDEEGKKTDG